MDTFGMLVEYAVLDEVCEGDDLRFDFHYQCKWYST